MYNVHTIDLYVLHCDLVQLNIFSIVPLIIYICRFKCLVQCTYMTKAVDPLFCILCLTDLDQCININK